MLQRKTVSAQLLGILEKSMSIEQFSDLRLVGGTALALQLGHRHSVDIDLFGDHDLRDTDISFALSLFGKVEELSKSNSIKIQLVDGVKVDIVKYRYAWLDPVVEIEGIRMASLRDIGAMKISAISQRGSKKDFIDLYFLLKHYTLKEIITFYNEKITDGNEWMALRSLPYFSDADQQPGPQVYNDISWEEVKGHIASEVKNYCNL